MNFLVTGGAGFNWFHGNQVPSAGDESPRNQRRQARFGVIMPEWCHAMELCIDEVLEVR